MIARMFNRNNLLHDLFLTQSQITKLRISIENNLQTDVKLSKAQISKIIQYGEFLGKMYGPLLKTGLPLSKSVIKTTWIIRFNSCQFSNRCRSSKKDIWFWNNNFSNFK